VRPGEGGAALLVVIAATAGLTVMTSMLLLSGRVAYEIAGMRADSMQAAALAEGTIRQAIAALEAAALSPPAAGTPLRVLNGVAPGGLLLPVARFPRPPGPARWPAITEDPEIRPPGGGLGAEVILEVVVGPRGEVRSRFPGGEGTLMRASARAWFRGAVAERAATLLAVGGAVRRLD